MFHINTPHSSDTENAKLIQASCQLEFLNTVKVGNCGECVQYFSVYTDINYRE